MEGAIANMIMMDININVYQYPVVMLIVAIRITRLYIYLLRDLFVCVGNSKGPTIFGRPFPGRQGTAETNHEIHQ